jgi:hypothetical protein
MRAAHEAVTDETYIELLHFVSCFIAEQAFLPGDRLSSLSSRLKGGCGHDWPPHSLPLARH